MELARIIRRLRQERDRLNEVLTALRDLKLKQEAQAAMPPPKRERRGRKSMGADERAEVSQRMKQYWAGRRAEKQKNKH
jgi:hypothetical protein